MKMKKLKEAYAQHCKDVAERGLTMLSLYAKDSHDVDVQDLIRHAYLSLRGMDKDLIIHTLASDLDLAELGASMLAEPTDDAVQASPRIATGKKVKPKSAWRPDAEEPPRASDRFFD